MAKSQGFRISALHRGSDFQIQIKLAVVEKTTIRFDLQRL